MGQARWQTAQGGEEAMKKTRGVYEKMPGSDVYWIRYADASGRIRREKVGPKSAALKLYHKRKTEVLQGKKLPETLRNRAVLFTEIADDAVEYCQVGYLLDSGSPNM